MDESCPGEIIFSCHIPYSCIFLFGFCDRHLLGAERGLEFKNNGLLSHFLNNIEHYDTKWFDKNWRISQKVVGCHRRRMHLVRFLHCCCSLCSASAATALAAAAAAAVFSGYRCKSSGRDLGPCNSGGSTGLPPRNGVGLCQRWCSCVRGLLVKSACLACWW